MSELTPSTDEPFDLELLSAALRADTADIDVFFRVLGDKLVDILGPRVEIERSGGLRRKNQQVVRISVELAGDQLQVSRHKGSIRCGIAHMVRGVVLKTEEVDLGQWMTALASRLQEESRHSASTRAALETLLT